MTDSQTPDSPCAMHQVWQDLLNISPDDPTLAWQPLQPGVDICPLQGKRHEGISSALLRYQPGASVPRHIHVGHEYLMILRGSQRDEHSAYRQGSFIVNPPGTSHQVTSDDGCLVLAIWEAPVQFIK